MIGKWESPDQTSESLVKWASVDDKPDVQFGKCVFKVLVFIFKLEVLFGQEAMMKMLKRQGLAGAEPKTRRRGLKLPATAHGRAADHGARAGQSRNGIFWIKKEFSWNASGAGQLLLTNPSCLPSTQQHNGELNPNTWFLSGMDYIILRILCK